MLAQKMFGLMKRRDVIAGLGATAAWPLAARAQAKQPVLTGDDPIANGLVASYNRPGGNLTGVSRLGTLLAAKNLELLNEVLPGVSVIGLMVNPKRPTAEAQIKNVREATAAFGKTIRVLNASDEREIDAAFMTAVSERIGGLLVAFDAALNISRKKIIALAAQHAVPTAYSTREFVAEGGLMSYGDDFKTSFKLVGELASRILKGARPADLPVQQATKVDLFINLKTAKALGLTIPTALLGRADEVIE